MASHPSLVPVLQTLDPLKLGKEIFKKMGLNIEALQVKEIEAQVFVSPEKENMIVLNPGAGAVSKFNGIIPDPKPGENHDEHLELHLEARNQLDLQGQNTQEIDRHLRLHLFLKDRKEAVQAPSVPPQGANGAGGPQQPSQGPPQLPGQLGVNRVEPK